MGQKASKKARDNVAPARAKEPGPRTVDPTRRIIQVPVGEASRRTANQTPVQYESAKTMGNRTFVHTHSVGAIKYRQLDQTQNEIRLLRILPPTGNRVSRDLELDPEIVCCQLEYETLERIDEVNHEARVKKSSEDRILDLLFAPVPGHSLEEGRTFGYLKQRMHEDFQDLDPHRTFQLHPQRKQLLRTIFETSSERQKQWIPARMRSPTTGLSFDRWINTWVYSPLSGDASHPEKSTEGYLALSYVWSNDESFADSDDHVRSLMQLSQAAGIKYSDWHKVHFSPVPDARSSGASSTSTGRIVVDGVLIEVSRNLEKALRTLREIPEVQCGKRVWVDSLCINQEDLEERAREVRKMGMIYGKAERVVSWIGDEQDCSGDVLEFMNTIGERVSFESEMSELNEWFYKQMESELGLRLAQFFTRPYWSRIWVVQEIVYGNDKAITICGPRRFATSMLLTFGARVHINKPFVIFNKEYDLARGLGLQSKPVLAQAIPSGLGKLRDLRQLQVNLEAVTGPSHGISTFMFRVPSTNFATDPRDVVYGMFNLLSKEMASLLRIDYTPTWSYLDVMVDFASAQIHSMSPPTRLKWMLYRPWRPFPGWEHWPSWVPNLGLPFSSANFLWTMNGDNCNAGYEGPVEYKIMTGAHAPVLACTGLFVDMISEATISVASHRIRERQIFLDYPELVDELAPEFGISPDELRRENASAMTSEFPEPPSVPDLRIQISETHRYGELQGLKDALATCFGRMRMQTASSQDSIFDIPLALAEQALEAGGAMGVFATPAMGNHAMPLLARLIRLIGDFDLWGTSLRSLWHRTTVSDQHHPELTLTDRTAGIARLFKTASGYVGAALCPLRRGDHLVVVPGCPMPVVLRRKPDTELQAYELLGGVFVPGLMNGELYRTLDSAEVQQMLKYIVLV